MSIERMQEIVSQNAFCVVWAVVLAFFGVALFTAGTANGYGYGYGYGYNCDDVDHSDSQDQDKDSKKETKKEKKEKKAKIEKISVRECFDPTTGKVAYRVVVYGKHLDREPRLRFGGNKPYKITNKGRSKIIAYFSKLDEMSGEKVKVKLKSRDGDFDDYSKKYELVEIKQLEERKISRVLKHK